MVKDVIMDSMHLINAGVMKRLMEFWLNEKRGVGPGRLSEVQKTELNRRTLEMKADIPIEFHRKMRSSSFFRNMKNTEFRFFLNYAGPVCLKGILSDDHYNNFLMLHVPIRLLSGPSAATNVGASRPYLDRFQRDTPRLYGSWFNTINVHILGEHLADDVEYSGENLSRIGAFPFENHLGKMTRFITNPN